jgi:hypothetical protein
LVGYLANLSIDLTNLDVNLTSLDANLASLAIDRKSHIAVVRHIAS